MTYEEQVKAAQTYYSVSEEVWFQTGPDDADRDFVDHTDHLTFADALEDARTRKTTNRIYIDEMHRTGTGAWGQPVWKGDVRDGQLRIESYMQLTADACAAAAINVVN
jgi:hypothetical protein